jgi:hypothetical protein
MGADVGIPRSDSAQSLRLMDHQQVSEDGGLHHVDMRKFLIRVQVLLKSKSKLYNVGMFLSLFYYQNRENTID